MGTEQRKLSGVADHAYAVGVAHAGESRTRGERQTAAADAIRREQAAARRRRGDYRAQAARQLLDLSEGSGAVERVSGLGAGFPASAGAPSHLARAGPIPLVERQRRWLAERQRQAAASRRERGERGVNCERAA